MPRQIIEIPKDAVPGDPLYVVLPNGRTVRVIVPNNARTGELYAVEHESTHLSAVQRSLVDISDSARTGRNVYPVLRARALDGPPVQATSVMYLPARAPPPNAPEGGRYAWVHFYSWLSCLGHCAICFVGCPCLCCATCCFPVDVQNVYLDNDGTMWDLDGRRHRTHCCERILAFDD